MKFQSCPANVSRTTIHDLAQPLNVIRLAVGNIRIRTLPQLTHAEADYLFMKLERIERQVDRTVAMLEKLHDPADQTSHEGI